MTTMTALKIQSMQCHLTQISPKDMDSDGTADENDDDVDGDGVEIIKKYF